jgi:myo-inositol-1(or 4)-monophosphatase
MPCSPRRAAAATRPAPPRAGSSTRSTAPRTCYPRFAVSLGVERDGEPALGVVYDPLLDELYHAVAGAGAFRNGRAIRVSRGTHRERALLATGVADDKAVSDDDHLAEFRAALEHKLKRWDVAAGGLIVREAGGRVTDRSGGGTWRSGHDIVATNGGIHDALLSLLAGARGS